MLEFVENTVTVEYKNMTEVANKYNKDAEVVNEFMMNFSDIAEEMNNSIEEIVKAINETTLTIANSASGIQNISEKSSNISEKLQYVNESAIENIKSVEKFGKIIKEFKL